MNWSRTKTIFIIAFLILNSFLGYQLWEKTQSKQLELAQLNESSLEELLALRNITLEIELQAEQPEMSQINAQFLTNTFEDMQKVGNQSMVFQEHKLISTLEQPIQLNEEWKQEEFEQQVLQNYVIRGNQYVFDQKTENQILYLQGVEGYPIFIGTLRFYLDGQQRVTGYEQIYYQVINTGTKQPVISPYSSIRTLLDNQVIPPFSRIQDVRLGYYGQVYEIESQVLTPAWRILIETEGKQKVIYVNAITGAIETEYTR